MGEKGLRRIDIGELGPEARALLGLAPCLLTAGGRPVAVLLPASLNAEAASARAAAEGEALVESWLSLCRQHGIGEKEGLLALEAIARTLSDAEG